MHKYGQTWISFLFSLTLLKAKMARTIFLHILNKLPGTTDLKNANSLTFSAIVLFSDVIVIKL